MKFYLKQFFTKKQLYDVNVLNNNSPQKTI